MTRDPEPGDGRDGEAQEEPEQEAAISLDCMLFEVGHGARRA